MSIPTDAEQLTFLTQVQKLLDEGQFVATYKFALLLGLIEAAVERGDDSGDPLKVDLDLLAEKFIELYWGHTRTFGGMVLSQNKGRNIGVLASIEALQRNTMVLAEARRLPQWASARSRVRTIVCEMPLFRLQLLRGGQRVTFLYEEAVTDHAIWLKPGVVYCLRKFSMLLASLARNGWLREVRDNPRNAYAVGATQSLETFLFGDDRVPLGRVRDVLMPVQEERCFYCGERLRIAHVDHFIPWALYPSNLGHNFVLADARCNADKSDLLADIHHFARWNDRNARFGATLGAALNASGFVCDLEASRGIARWAYERARATRAVLWSGYRNTTAMTPDPVLRQ